MREQSVQLEPAGELVPDPQTGELIDLRTAPPELLAEAAWILSERERAFRGVRQAVEAELRERLKQSGRRRDQFGRYQLALEPVNRREWDPEELEQCVRALIDEGVVRAGEVTGLLRHETVVSGKTAQTLLGRLSGEPATRLSRCFRWVRHGQPRLTITTDAQGRLERGE